MVDQALFKKYSIVIYILILLLFSYSRISTAAEISIEFNKDITRLMKLTNSEAMAVQMGNALTNQMMDSLSKRNLNIPLRVINAIKVEIHKVFSEEMPNLMADMVMVYANNFTHEDIKGLIAFYETPLGMKSIKVMPSVMKESMELGQRWGQGLAPKLRPRVQFILQKEGIDH
ncbi:MAG: DUF2059 domain-containing protein [Thermodesulfobacteriota bacterium]